jgi:hypothetical protein
MIAFIEVAACGFFRLIYSKTNRGHVAAWDGFQSYFLTNGTSDDGWGACDANAGCKMYAESNLTAVRSSSLFYRLTQRRNWMLTFELLWIGLISVYP